MPASQLNRSITLLPAATIGAAAAGVLSPVLSLTPGILVATIQATFLYGSGGTNVKAYIQTSLDGQLSWFDIACMTFTTAAAKKISSVKALTAVAASYTPTDGTLADDTIKDGLLGNAFRVTYTSTGTYAGATSLAIYISLQGQGTLT